MESVTLQASKNYFFVLLIPIKLEQRQKAITVKDFKNNKKYYKSISKYKKV